MNLDARPTTQGSEAFALDGTHGFNLPVTIINPSWGVGMAGVLEDFTPGEAKVNLEGLVSTGTMVEVQIGNCVFSGEVLFCERRGGGFETHVSINDFDESGLRRTPRFPVTLPCVVSSATIGAPASATIVDISGDGLGIELSTNLPLNSTIAVDSDSNVALGIVRYSQEIGPLRYRVGVQLHHIAQRTSLPTVSKARTGMIGKMNSRFSFSLRRQ